MKVLRLQSGCLRIGDFLLVVVESDNISAAFFHRARREQTRTAEAKNRDPLPSERGDRNQGSSQLECREPGKCQHNGDNPEAYHDLRLGPTKLLGVVVDRRHLEYTLTEHPVRDNLDDD